MSESLYQIPWEQLLTDINKRQVLPIIGPALVTVKNTLPSAKQRSSVASQLESLTASLA